jgi:nitrogen fixation/metabolism regulation signal transduction histidine kinase
VEKNEINEVMRNASIYITKDRLEQIMNIESRIHLYKDKFGLKSDDQLFYDGLKNLFQHARDLIDDDELFFQETVQTIKNYSWLPTFI